MMDDAISGIDSTVAVASRSEYSFPSAGAICGVWPMKASLCFSNWSRNSSMVRLVRNPGIDSSLSSVPPVCPSARPEIMGTTTPAAAASGAAIRLVLSPTPPVECLSTFIPGMDDRSTVSPDCTIRSVSALTSRSVMPEKKTAIRNADNLIIRDGSAGITVNEESDFVRRKFFAVPLAMDQVDSSH